MTDDVTLVDSTPGDDGFLFKVYAGARRDEVAAWGWGAAQQEAFLRMQFTARKSGYSAQYPGAAISIIRLGAVAVGAMIVDRSLDEIVLVDIALLPEYRQRGIGRRRLEELCAEASESHRPLRLSVFKGNRAIGLYERTGFSIIGDDGVYLKMEHKPTG